MFEGDIIDLTEEAAEEEEEEDAAEEPEISRRDVLSTFIQSTVVALGGYITTENGPVYEMGDSCLGCLRDLKKFWRKDDNDDERTVARIFWDTQVLPNDLIPILLETAGKGAVMDKRAIACADLITAMTWPIDVAEELQELDDEIDAKTDYTTLLFAQLRYKAALLTPEVLKALLAIMAPSLAKTKRDRTERDTQIVNVILHAFRNLAFIKDPPADAFKSSDRAEYSSLQSKMIVLMKETQILEIFTTLAANATDSLYNPFNATLLEIYYLLLRGVKPAQLTLTPSKQTSNHLNSLLAIEASMKQAARRQTATRHSRFGTTIAIRAGQEQYIVHTQTGITDDPSRVMGRDKMKPVRKIKKQDELASFEQLSTKALAALQQLAKDFMDSCFETFFSSLLKDINAERAKITESDNIRLLAVVRWFLQFFLASRGKELADLKAKGVTGPEYETLRWRFEMVAEVVERGWVGWVLKRMRMAMDDKPKQWTELRAGMDCLSQLLLLLEQMSLPDSPEFAHEASLNLQHQLYYSGEILEISFDSLKGYKEQSIAYLDSTIHLAYLLLKMLERWAKTQGQMYVRKNKKAKQKNKKVGEEDGIVDVGSDDDEDSRPGDSMWNEHMFTFEKYESKFAQEDITRACLAYLERYREFESSEQMKRVVSLMHRQAVKVKAEGLYFKVTTLDLFNRILDDQKTLPRDATHKELVQMITFLLRKFFKAVQENPFLVVEAFYPKNRGQWKQFSSYEPPTRENANAEGGRGDKAKNVNADLEVKKGWSDEEKLGIAIGVLVQQNKMGLVDFVRSTLMTVIGLRLAIMSDVAREMEIAGASNIVAPGTSGEGEGGDPSIPSAEAMQRIEDYSIPYVTEEQAQAATKDPYVKLVLRLVDCHITDPNAEELEWFIPAAVTPDDLQKHLDVIARYLEEPIDLGGQEPSSFLQKKRAPRGSGPNSRASRRRRRATDGNSSSDGEANALLDEDDDLLPRKRRTKRQKEEVIYKSAEFIDDSDVDDPVSDAAFWAKEQELRARSAAAALAEGGGGSLMRATGTKKRKRGANKAPIAAESVSPPAAGGVGGNADEEPAGTASVRLNLDADTTDDGDEVTRSTAPATATKGKAGASRSRKRVRPSSKQLRRAESEEEDGNSEPAAESDLDHQGSASGLGAANGGASIRSNRVTKPRPRPKARYTGPRSVNNPSATSGLSSPPPEETDGIGETISSPVTSPAPGTIPGTLSDNEVDQHDDGTENEDNDRDGGRPGRVLGGRSAGRHLSRSDPTGEGDAVQSTGRKIANASSSGEEEGEHEDEVVRLTGPARSKRKAVIVSDDDE